MSKELIDISSRYHDCIELIYKNLKKLTSRGYGILDGGMGVAFFYYYYGLLNNTNLKIVIEEEIERSFNTLQTFPPHSTFASGYAGFLYGLNLFNKLSGEKYELDETSLQVLTRHIDHQLKNDISNNYYDYLHGYTGIGLYYLSSNNLIQVSNIIETLHKTKEIISPGNYGWASLDAKKNRIYNLGLSHGISGIVGFLTQSLKADVDSELSKDLLEGAINYLISTKKDNELSLFPYYSNTTYDTRLAWCYGDLGIAVSIMSAAKVCNHKEWEKIAVEIAKHCAKRLNTETTGVVDSCFCHGSAGLQYIFERFYLVTKEPIFAEAMEFWSTKTLTFLSYQHGEIEIKTWYGSNENWVHNQAGILEGMTGIGLSLMHYLQPKIKPIWQESLLIDF